MMNRKRIILLCGGSFIILLFMNLMNGATLTLYPNGDTSQKNFTPSSGTNNFAMVDELYVDTGVTYNAWGTSKVKGADLLELQNSSLTGNIGIINNITVYAWWFNYIVISGGTGYFQIGIKSGSTINWSAETSATNSSLFLYSSSWNLNPDTGVAWTWSDIDKLQAGYRANDSGGMQVTCTQLWVVVDYSLTSGEILRPDGDISILLTPTPASATNFIRINESIINYSDYVSKIFNISLLKDIYSITNGTKSGNINSFSIVGFDYGGIFGFETWGYYKYSVNVSGTEYVSDKFYMRTSDYHSVTWNNNPATGNNWTWAEINTTSIGLYIQTYEAGGFWYAGTYQLYVIVNYTAEGCVCPGAGQNWVIPDSCILSTNCDLTVGNFTITSGNFTLTNGANLTCEKFAMKSGGRLIMSKGSKIIIHK